MTGDKIIVNRDTSLVEVLDRVIHTGVVLKGDATISVADVNLVYLGLQIVLCSVDRLCLPEQPLPQDQRIAPQKVSKPEAALSLAPALGVAASPEFTQAAVAIEPGFMQAHPLPATTALPALADNRVENGPERGLAQLVLTLVELLRDLMERQAVRRIENNTVTDEQIARMGENFMLIAQRMDELKAMFNLTDDDLNIDLGPLGHLLDKE